MEDREQLFNQLASTYSIDIKWESAIFPARSWHGVISGNMPSISDVVLLAPLLEREFGIYPVDIIRKAKLHRIVLCQNLTYDGEERGTALNFKDRTIYLDVIRCSTNRQFYRRAFHHELFHIFDLFVFGTLYRDSKWEKLNPARFKYGSGGKNMRNLTAGLPDWSLRGFLTQYSRAGLEEDKAEIFSHMIVDYEEVERRAEQDEVIKAKVSYLKSLFIRACPEMDEAFWHYRRLPYFRI